MTIKEFESEYKQLLSTSKLEALKLIKRMTGLGLKDSHGLVTFYGKDIHNLLYKEIRNGQVEVINRQLCTPTWRLFKSNLRKTTSLTSMIKSIIHYVGVDVSNKGVGQLMYLSSQLDIELYVHETMSERSLIEKIYNTKCNQ